MPVELLLGEHRQNDRSKCIGDIRRSNFLDFSESVSGGVWVPVIDCSQELVLRFPGELFEGECYCIERICLEGECVERSMPMRSEEHTSELQSLMRISYAVFCLKKKKTKLI